VRLLAGGGDWSGECRIADGAERVGLQTDDWQLQRGRRGKTSEKEKKEKKEKKKKKKKKLFRDVFAGACLRLSLSLSSGRRRLDGI